MKKQIDSVTEFDFGFSFADEDIDEVKASLEEQRSFDNKQIEELQSRVDLLYRSIIPFLDNLCKNPEKSTIHWPNRVEKIEQYKSKLKSIAEGNNNK